MTGFTTMMSNYAVNGMNALKHGARVGRGSFNEGMKAFQGGASMGQSLSAGMGVAKNAWKNGSNAGRAGMAGAGIGAAGLGVAGTVAAADFANPWGVGFGD